MTECSLDPESLSKTRQAKSSDSFTRGLRRLVRMAAGVAAEAACARHCSGPVKILALGVWSCAAAAGLVLLLPRGRAVLFLEGGQVAADLLAVVSASFCAGVALSGAGGALGSIDTDSEGYEQIPSGHWQRLRALAIEEVTGHDSNLRKTFAATAVGLLFVAYANGFVAALLAHLAFLSGVFLGLLDGMRGVLIILVLALPTSAAFGVGKPSGLGALVGAVALARFWVRFLQDRLLYRPRRYPESVDYCSESFVLGRQVYSLHKLTYDLQGRWGHSVEQTGFLVRPQEEPSVLWVLCGGNGMVAVDWLSHLNLLLKTVEGGDAGVVAFLLVDYPGYGYNGGRPSPAAILASSRHFLQQASESLGHVPVHLMGHSLGCAAVTQLAAQLAAEEAPAGRLVLSAPFTNVPSMAERILGGLLPGALQLIFPALLKCLVPHQWNNKALLPSVAKAGWQVGIIHGAMDTLVPPTMGCELHRLAAAAAHAHSPRFVEVPAAGHNDVLSKALRDYAKLMGLLPAEAAPVPGTCAVLEGLTGAQQLNGQRAVLQRWDAKAERWIVQLVDSGAEKSVRPENLKQLP